MSSDRFCELRFADVNRARWKILAFAESRKMATSKSNVHGFCCCVHHNLRLDVGDGNGKFVVLDALRSASISPASKTRAPGGILAELLTMTRLEP